jgi:hypothetical protein
MVEIGGDAVIPNDPVLTTDPFDAICTTLSSRLTSIVPSLKYAIQGWPDPKWFEDTGANFPSVFFVNVSETAKSMTSRNLVYASIQNSDGTQNVYYERQRMTYLLQISIFTTDPQQRLDIGWKIKQYLINTVQLPINTIDTAKFIFKDGRMPPGLDNLYQRDLTFEVTARVFDGEVVHTNRAIQQNNSIN